MKCETNSLNYLFFIFPKCAVCELNCHIFHISNCGMQHVEQKPHHETYTLFFDLMSLFSNAIIYVRVKRFQFSFSCPIDGISNTSTPHRKTTFWLCIEVKTFMQSTLLLWTLLRKILSVDFLWKWRHCHTLAVAMQTTTTTITVAFQCTWHSTEFHELFYLVLPVKTGGPLYA